MKKFISEMLSSGDEVSSKRVVGVLLISIYLLIFVLAFFIEFKEVHINMANNMFMAGVGLLGLGFLDKLPINKK